MNEEFLLKYVPADQDITNREEIDLIIKELNLYSKTKKELHDLRDNIVEFYQPYIDKQFDKQTDHNYWQAMLSVTAVIDKQIYHHIYKEEGI